MTLAEINQLPENEAIDLFRQCCGVESWAAALVATRPFSSAEALEKRAEEIWFDLGEQEWLKTFDYHAKIGDVESLKKKLGSRDWSSNEQSGIEGAGQQVIAELAEGNIAYEKKFGFIFLIFATGKSAADMLAILKQRINNERPQEIENVATEQNKITLLRIRQLFTEG